MSRTADDRKTNIAAAQFLAKAGHITDEQGASQLLDAAADLAHTDQMPLYEALKIVAGVTRRPYGTPRNKL